jgi:hypothetical protein
MASNPKLSTRSPQPLRLPTRVLLRTFAKIGLRARVGSLRSLRFAMHTQSGQSRHTPPLAGVTLRLFRLFVVEPN